MAGCSCRQRGEDRVRAFDLTLRRTRFCGRIGRFAAGGCCSNARRDKSAQSLFQQICACPCRSPWSMLPKSRWTICTADIFWVSGSKTCDKYPRSGLRWRTTRPVGFGDKWRSISIVYGLLNIQKTTIHLVRVHLFSWPEARLSRCRGGIGLFFYPVKSRLVADAKSPR